MGSKGCFFFGWRCSSLLSAVCLFGLGYIYSAPPVCNPAPLYISKPGYCQSPKAGAQAVHQPVLYGSLGLLGHLVFVLANRWMRFLPFFGRAAPFRRSMRGNWVLLMPLRSQPLKGMVVVNVSAERIHLVSLSSFSSFFCKSWSNIQNILQQRISHSCQLFISKPKLHHRLNISHICIMFPNPQQLILEICLWQLTYTNC